MVGPEAFSGLATVAKYTHNFVSFSFVIGLVLIIANWIKDNVPRKVDLDWLKQGGGFIKSRHAPAGRFNAGDAVPDQGNDSSPGGSLRSDARCSGGSKSIARLRRERLSTRHLGAPTLHTRSHWVWPRNLVE